MRVSVTKSWFAQKIAPKDSLIQPVKAQADKIKTFSKIKDRNELIGSEALFSRNHKRRQNAVVLTDHALVLELRSEAFDMLVKD